MRLGKQTREHIEIVPEEREDIEEILLAIAEHSYETAVQGGLSGHLHSPPEKDEEVNFRDCLYHANTGKKELIALHMGYINARDCRTTVVRGHTRKRANKWYFSVFDFEQRGITMQELFQGVKKYNAIEFLEEVAKKLEKKQNL